MVSLSKMKLEELIFKAQQCNYVPPEGDMTNWSDDDAVLAGTYEFITSPLFIRICGMVCKMFPPIKMIIKQNLRTYITKYDTI
jgi:hypothetical protein